MGAEHAPVDMCLVYHHDFKVVEKSRPCLVIGQDAHMQHIRIGQYNAGGFFNIRSVPLWSVTVEGITFPGLDNVRAGKLIQTAQLVLCQRFGGKQV